MINKLPFLFIVIVILIFTIGYVSHSILGKNNPIEEIAEDILKKEYNIDVEFSGDENDTDKKDL